MRGLDASQSGIAIANAVHAEATFQIHRIGAALPAELHARFDAVISIEVIEHMLLPRDLIRTALEALAPGGLLIVSTPHHGYFKNLALALAGRFDEHWHPLRDFGHVKFFSKATLSALFQEFGLEGIGSCTVGRVPPFARSLVLFGRKPR
jgi:2-polyprenyl-6-hydroxyphenyl methylase/3-demethylubiquinone-9 3-methyltransferase